MIKISVKNKVLALLCIVVLLTAVIAPLFASPKKASAAENSITVFSWEDYIDEGDPDAEDDYLRESILDIFEQETGITVYYRTFATNEAMYNELKKDPTACDIICPSEYMIMKMMAEDLIQPYEAPSNYVQYGSKYIKNVFDGLGLNTEDGKTYAIGYMWGTMGYIYNMNTTTADELKNWDAIFNEKFNGKTTIKDSVRDTYIMALAIVYKEELLALDKTAADYNEKLTAIFNRTDLETVRKVGDMLIDLRPKLYGFEVDGGKDDIKNGRIDVNFAWSGDAVAAIDEATRVDLGYVVPEEGSNVWFDGWVMTKSADVEKSRKFLDFVCRPDNVIRNMDYIGYVSCVGGKEVFSYVTDSYGVEDGEYEVDLTYFFDDNFVEGYSNPEYVVTTDEIGRSFSALYAEYDVIKRCAVMKNFTNEELLLIDDMWNSVKFITWELWQILLVVGLIILAVAGVMVYKYWDKLFPPKIPKEKKNVKSDGFKAIKRKEIK